MKGFISFIREQGVIGLAIGFILGGAVSNVAKSLASDIIYPIVSLVLSPAQRGIGGGIISIAGAQINYGSFLSNIINFVILALVIYFGFKGLKLDKLDKKNESK